MARLEPGDVPGRAWPSRCQRGSLLGGQRHHLMEQSQVAVAKGESAFVQGTLSGALQFSLRGVIQLRPQPGQSVRQVSRVVEVEVVPVRRILFHVHTDAGEDDRLAHALCFFNSRAPALEAGGVDDGHAVAHQEEHVAVVDEPEYLDVIVQVVGLDERP